MTRRRARHPSSPPVGDGLEEVSDARRGVLIEVSSSELLNALRRARAHGQLALSELRRVRSGEQLSLAVESLEAMLEELELEISELEDE